MAPMPHRMHVVPVQGLRVESGSEGGREGGKEGAREGGGEGPASVLIVPRESG